MTDQAVVTDFEKSKQRAAEAIERANAKKNNAQRNLGGGEGERFIEGAPAVHHKKASPYYCSRAVAGLLTGQWDANSVERDMHEQLADRAGEDPDKLLRNGKVCLPWSAKRMAGVFRDMNTWDDTKAGALIQQETGELIDMLRDRLVLTDAGVRQITIGGGGISFPRQKGGVTTAWVDEGATISTSDLDLGKLSLRPHKLAAAVAIPNEALEDTNPDLEELVRQDIVASFAIEEEHAFFFGTGGGAQPRGFIFDPDVSEESSSLGNPDFDDLLDLMNALENSKGNPARAAFITFPNVKYRLYKLREGALDSNDAAVTTVGGYLFMVDPQDPTRPIFQGSPILTTTNIAGTSASGEDIIAYGEWAEALIARTESLVIDASEHVKFLEDVTVVRGTERVDMGLRRPDLFKFVSGVTT